MIQFSTAILPACSASAGFDISFKMLFTDSNCNSKLFTVFCHTIESKVIPYLITSIGHGGNRSFLAVSPQVTLVINPVVGCRYFTSKPRLISQPKRSTPWPVPNYTAWRQRHTMQWCPAMVPLLTQ